uniref:ATP synthase subunit a n=1 Tax=Andalucia godoyi TaxID=505711 RepID=M4QKK5_ANDGO|nr:ATP synthase F0 subunit a [Andalucia godoyi]AGH24003.1 ATP synthase F0 subunit a [Andalucia godoyi]
MFISSPFEQFQIVSFLPIKFGTLNLSFTNSSFYMLLVVLFIIALFALSTQKATIIPSRWQSIVEMLYEFVHNLVEEQVGPKGLRYFPVLFSVFLFILVSNLLGMIPYSFTVTSHIIVTFGLALAVFIGINIIGLSIHGAHFFSLFLPQGAPLALAPFLVLIELISYLFRVVSLAVRLFANMMSGHSLLKILSGFAWTMMCMGGFMFVASFIPLAIIFALTGLELAIAFLQAYVFTLLTCIYLNDAINLH